MSQIRSTRPLTRREIEVIVLLGHGKNSREVADTLLIEPRTVQFHVYNIYRKLGCKNTLSLIREAQRRGLGMFDGQDEFIVVQELFFVDTKDGKEFPLVQTRAEGPAWLETNTQNS